MEKDYFVNRYFEESLGCFINKSKVSIDYKIFNNMVINALANIYSELDLVNPYITSNVKALIDNMAKYGYSRSEVLVFFDAFEKYNEIAEFDYINKKNTRNPYFVKVQKLLIDMYFCKKNLVEINNDEQYDFYNLLFIPSSKNEFVVKYNLLKSQDESEIDNYFRTTLYNFNHPKVIEETVFEVEEEPVEDKRKFSFAYSGARGNVSIVVILAVISIICIGIGLLLFIVG